MHIFRLAAVCAVLFGTLAGRPACAAEVGGSPEAQVRAIEADWEQARHYHVILNEFHFAPSRIVLQQGDPYALRLENRGRFRHTFTAPEFFRAVTLRPGGAASEAEQSGGSLSIAPGEVVEIEFVPLQPAAYALECTKPLHGVFGMTGDIVVEQHRLAYGLDRACLHAGLRGRNAPAGRLRSTGFAVTPVWVNS